MKAIHSCSVNQAGAVRCFVLFKDVNLALQADRCLVALLARNEKSRIGLACLKGLHHVEPINENPRHGSCVTSIFDWGRDAHPQN